MAAYRAERRTREGEAHQVESTLVSARPPSPADPNAESSTRLMLRKSVCDVYADLGPDLANFSPSYIQTQPTRYKEKSLLPRRKSSGYNEIRLDTKRAHGRSSVRVGKSRLERASEGGFRGLTNGGRTAATNRRFDASVVGVINKIVPPPRLPRDQSARRHRTLGMAASKPSPHHRIVLAIHDTWGGFRAAVSIRFLRREL